MPSSLITLLVVAAACLLLGGIAGLLLSALLSSSEENNAPSQPSAPPGGGKGRYRAVARLWRETSSQALIVEMDGKSYLSPQPLSAEQRAALEKAALDLSLWAGMPREQVPAQPVSQPVEPAPPAGAPAAVAPVKPPSQSIPPVAAYSPPVDLPVPLVVKPLEQKPMLEQINEVIKEMSAGTPYELRGISLTSDPRRGVIVWVGSSRYEGVDGVTDPEVQKFIRSAVAEWERRQDEADRLKRIK